jgi:hypothetical protein
MYFTRDMVKRIRINDDCVVDSWKFPLRELGVSFEADWLGLMERMYPQFEAETYSHFSSLIDGFNEDLVQMAERFAPDIKGVLTRKYPELFTVDSWGKEDEDKIRGVQNTKLTGVYKLIHSDPVAFCSTLASH